MCVAGGGTKDARHTLMRTHSLPEPSSIFLFTLPTARGARCAITRVIFMRRVHAEYVTALGPKQPQLKNYFVHAVENLFFIYQQYYSFEVSFRVGILFQGITFAVLKSSQVLVYYKALINSMHTKVSIFYK